PIPWRGGWPQGRVRDSRAALACPGYLSPLPGLRDKGGRMTNPSRSSQASAAEPSPDFDFCPRLHGFIPGWGEREPSWFNAPVRTFLPPEGAESVRLLIVGLAPGLRGANRTGRPFTGDYAGDLLYSTLTKYGFARGKFEARPDDSLQLVGTAI